MTPEAYLSAFNWIRRRNLWKHHRHGAHALDKAVELQVAERREVLAFEAAYVPEPAKEVAPEPAKHVVVSSAPLVMGIAGEGDDDEPVRIAAKAATPKRRPVVVPPPPPPPPAEPEPEPEPEAKEDAEDEPEPLVKGHVCQPQATTREVMAARAGITHKHIEGDPELDLIRRYKAGDRHAGEILLRAHAKFISFNAHRFCHFSHDLSPEDLLAEAQLGFLEGVLHFDESKGFKLVTYANHWLRHVVRRTAENIGNTIRVPNRFSKKEVLNADGKLAACARAAKSMSSLDALISDDAGSETSFLAMTPGDGPTPEEALSTHEDDAATAEHLEETMAALPVKWADILRRRAAGESLQAIGESYGVSRERIRQIEEKARAAAQKRYLKTEKRWTRHVRSEGECDL